MSTRDSLERTGATLILFGVWAAIVLGPMFFPEADPPPPEIRFTTTAVAFLVIGQMWNIDFERAIDGITISIEDRPRNDDGD
ncbi:hypothetical protein [Natronobacterium texcoconense]|uniref:Uncharacterized protein n=1 Tax=Natronobacterium texcoconense TaxID=1095778 RepID=A0A1H1HJ60_NATTX|nr:hypothetical protein [Natronobacterium texcoconense]SDR25444.1 hypothetical protein SAMN04489842_2800 [Natronobacterium texcoconense]